MQERPFGAAGTQEAGLPGPRLPDETALAGLEELVRSHARLPSLFRENRDFVVLFAADGRIVVSNPVAAALSGFAPGELENADLQRRIDRAMVPSVVNNFRRAVRGETVEFELAMATKENERVELSAMLMPAIVDERIVGVYAIAKDVTPLKLAERTFDRRIQELSALIQHHPDALVSIDGAGAVTRVNAALEAMIGYREDEVLGRPYVQFLAAASFVDASKAFVRALAGETVRTALTIVHRNGRPIDVAGTVLPIRVDGEIVGLYAIGHDVSDQRRLEASVSEQTDRLRDLYLVAATTGRDPEVQIDAALELGARTLRCERAFLAHVQERIVTVTRAIGCDDDPPRDRPLAESLIRFPMQTGDIFAVDDLGAPPWNAILGKDDARSVGMYVVPIDAGGQRYGAVTFASHGRREVPFSASDREFLRLVGALIGSAVERAAQQRRLDTLAFFDSLTGLPNRVLLGDRLEGAIASAGRRNAAFAVHFVDLDGFKDVNGAYGHAHGDVVLRALAQRFERVTRNEDLIARVGGDEFVVLQYAVDDPREATLFAERLREAIGAPLEMDGNVHRVGVSIGIAIYPSDGLDGTTLLQHADEALYRAKSAGGDGVARFRASSS